MYLLDTSAWIAHYLGEPGVDEVTALFNDEDIVICVSTVSLIEVYIRLKSLGYPEKWQEVLSDYEPLFARLIPVHKDVALEAINLRAQTPKRLPVADSLIAATAVFENFTLVHRDTHMSDIPAKFGKQLVLPDK